MSARPAGLMMVVVAILGLSGCAEPRSDTGYHGTWIIANDRIETRFAIAPRGDGDYRVRVSQTTADGRSILSCGWDGECVQKVDGAVAARFRFTPRTDPATGHLHVRCEGGPEGPESPTVVYENELVVAADGLALTSFTTERAGQFFEGDARPRRDLVKLSDRVDDPPDDPR